MMEAPVRRVSSDEQWVAAMQDPDFWKMTSAEPDFWKMRKPGQVPFNWEATPGNPKNRLRTAYDSDDSQSVRSATGAGYSDEDSVRMKLKPPPSYRSFRDRTQERRYGHLSDTDSGGWSSDTPALVAQYSMSSSDAGNYSDSATPKAAATWLLPPRSAVTDRFYDAPSELPRMVEGRKESERPGRLAFSGPISLPSHAVERLENGSGSVHPRSDGSRKGKVLSDTSPSLSTNLSTMVMGNRSQGGNGNSADFSRGKLAEDVSLRQGTTSRSPPERKRVAGGLQRATGGGLAPVGEGEAYRGQRSEQVEVANGGATRDLNGHGGYKKDAAAYENQPGAMPVREAILQRFLIAADEMASRSEGWSQPSSIGSDSELVSEHGASYSTTSTETLHSSVPPMPISREPLWTHSSAGPHVRVSSSGLESELLQRRGGGEPAPPPPPPKVWQHNRIPSSGSDSSEIGESADSGNKADQKKGPLSQKPTTASSSQDGNAVAVASECLSSRERGVSETSVEASAPQAKPVIAATDSDSDEEYVPHGSRSAANFAGGLMTAKRSLSGMAIASMLCGVPSRNMGFALSRSYPSPPSTPSSTRSADNSHQFDHYANGQGGETSISGSQSPSSKGNKTKKEKPPLPPPAGYEGAAPGEKAGGKTSLFGRLLQRNSSKPSNALPPSAPRRASASQSSKDTRLPITEAANRVLPPVDTRPDPSPRALSRRARSLSREIFPEIDMAPINESEASTAESPFKSMPASQPSTPSTASGSEGADGWFSAHASFDSTETEPVAGLDTELLKRSGSSVAAIAATEAAATAAAMADAAVDAAKDAPSPTKKGSSPGRSDESPMWADAVSEGPSGRATPITRHECTLLGRGNRVAESSADSHADVKDVAVPHARAHSLPEGMHQEWQDQDRPATLLKSRSMSHVQYEASFTAPTLRPRDRRKANHSPPMELSPIAKEKLWAAWEQEIGKLDTMQSQSAASVARDSPSRRETAGHAPLREEVEMVDDDIKWAADSQCEAWEREGRPQIRSGGSLSPLVSFHGRVQSMEVVREECSWNGVETATAELDASVNLAAASDSLAAVNFAAASNSLAARMRALEEKMMEDEILLRESRERNATDRSSSAHDLEALEWRGPVDEEENAWKREGASSHKGLVGDMVQRERAGGGQVEELGLGCRPGGWGRPRSGVLMDWDPNPLGWEGINMDRLSLYCSNMSKDTPPHVHSPPPWGLHVKVDSPPGRESGCGGAERGRLHFVGREEEDERDSSSAGSPLDMRRMNADSPPPQWALNSPSPRGRPWEVPWDRWSTPALDEEAESFELEMRRRAAPVLTLTDSPGRGKEAPTERGTVGNVAVPSFLLQKTAPDASAHGVGYHHPLVELNGSSRNPCSIGTPPRPRSTGATPAGLAQNSRPSYMGSSSSPHRKGFEEPSLPELWSLRRAVDTNETEPSNPTPSHMPPGSVSEQLRRYSDGGRDSTGLFGGKVGNLCGGPLEGGAAGGVFKGKDSGLEREEEFFTPEKVQIEHLTPPGSPHIDPVAELWGMSRRDHPRKSGIPLAPGKGLSAAQAAQLATLTLNEKPTPEMSTMWASTESESRAIDLLISGAPILFMM